MERTMAQLASSTLSSPLPSAPAAARMRARPSRGPVRPQALFGGLGKKMDEFGESLKFDNWAPRSARAWGKGEYLNLSKEKPRKGEGGADGLLSEAMLQQIRQEEALKKMSPQEAAMARAFMEVADGMEGGEEEEAGGNTKVRVRTAYSIKERAEELNAKGYFDKENREEFELTGETLGILCFNKYGFFHDMAIKQTVMNKGMRRWVSFNLYFGYVGLRGFPYSDEEYVDKLDAVAAIIRALEQEEFVYDFFYEKIFPRRGLPSRPRQDTAVSLRLNQSPTWDPDVAEELNELGVFVE